MVAVVRALVMLEAPCVLPSEESTLLFDVGAELCADDVRGMEVVDDAELAV